MITLEMMLEFSSYELEKDIEYVLGYVRKSQPKQETKDEENRVEKDLEMQVARVEDYCERKGLKFKLFREVQSGENISDRPVMQAMLKEIQEGFCDAVVVVDYDRLSRGSGSDQERILNVLRNSATLIVEVAGIVYNPLNREDMERLKMKGFFSNFEYGKIVSRFSSYKRIGLKEGKWVSGEAPFGYDRDKKTKHLIINKEEGEIYQERILKPFLSGKLVDHITQELNNANIPSPRNKKWTTSTVVKLLKSDLYCGTLVSNKTSGSKKSMESINKEPFRKIPPEKWVYAYDAHPHLKTFEEHDEILKLFKMRGRVQAKAQLHPLHALVKCYNCGRSMHIQKKHGGQKIRLRSCECGENRGGSLDIVNSVVRDCILVLEEKLLAVDETPKAELKQAMYLKEVEKIKKEIVLNEQAIVRVESAYEIGEYTLEKMAESRRSRRKIIKDLNDKLKSIQMKQNEISVMNKEQKLEILNHFKEEILNHHENAEKLREIYASLFKNIIWKRTEEDRVRVSVNFL